MEKKIAILAVNPVNGAGLFQYLEAFYENGISYKIFAVADKKEITTNSGVPITGDDVIANLKGHEDEFDGLVFACGDAMPTFRENATTSYNQDMMAVIANFGQKHKIMIGHCVAGMLFDIAGVANGKKVSVHPLAMPAISKAIAVYSPYAVDGTIFTAQTESTISCMLPAVINALK